MLPPRLDWLFRRLPLGGGPLPPPALLRREVDSGMGGGWGRKCGLT